MLPSVLPLVLMGACGGEADPEAGSARPPPAEDPRIAWLLAPCVNSGHYDVNTADILPILVETVLHGQRDPLQRARIELARQGPEGLEAARRLIERYRNDPAGVYHVRNAIDVVTLSEEPGAREVLVDCIRSRLSESLQLLALRGLRKHGKSQDYDLALEQLEVVSPEFRPELAVLLEKLDPARAARQFGEWIRSGTYPGTAPVMAALLGGSQAREAGLEAKGLWSGAAPLLRPSLAAAAAREGDEEGLVYLREEQRAGEAERRRAAIDALSQARLGSELVWSLREDPSPGLRLAALQGLAEPQEAERGVGPEALRSLLRERLADPDERVRAGALQALAASGDPRALDDALELLSDPAVGALALGMRALEPRIAQDEALATRAFERLRVRHEAEAARPLAERSDLLHAIGRIPIEPAARLLLDQEGDAQGSISGLHGRRWLMLQVGNTGEPGQRLLARELERERDVVRRLDLIEGLSVRPTELARQALLELVELGEASPYEILYAADRLVRLGPAAEVAPVLKRATLRVVQPDVRMALQCLLWASYPGPR
ncbi:MAG TPA: HEAT repeat domain-containing protein [Planctomycetota bacterium]|nr:HEAT repeat domain-containing protein [Planctomycetota bacterium]